MSKPDLPSKNDPVSSKNKPSEPSLLSGLDHIHSKTGLWYPKCESKIGSRGRPLGSLIDIFIATPDGLHHPIKINQHATIIELKQKAHENTGAPLDRIRFTYAGKNVGGLYGARSEEDNLSAYDIRPHCTLHLMLSSPDDGPSILAPASKMSNCQAQNKTEAASVDYDEDPHIVDPQSHFHRLRQLERDVFQRSEYFRTKGECSVSSALDPVDDDGVFLDELGLRPTLRRKIRGSSIVTRTLQEMDPSSGTFWQLLKSYSIILNASRSLEQMVSLRFCTDAINILVAHERVEVIEIKRVPLEMITDIENGLEAAVGQVLETNLKERSLAAEVTDLVVTPCRRLLEQVGSHRLPSDASALGESLAVIRGVALLIDVGLVSYVRSHGSGFDDRYDSHRLRKLEVNYGEKLIFGCHWARLACLDSFLDRKYVWVFDFSPRRKKDGKPCSKSLLARMEDLADIWGPIYAVPTSTGLVKYYGVSKGVIYRVESKTENAIPGAILCHYSSRLSFVKEKASRLLANVDDLALSQDDLLLIGAGFRENRNCQYTMSAFTKESASAMTVLGTKDSVWKTDSRGLTVGLSKYLGVTISGTQKLIPQTTLKQHILDKWKTMPSRSNPMILNQYLGVEISHCTGNARRISLKALMISKPIRPILERQIPNWPQTPWGMALCKALHSPEPEDIVNVWKEYASNRSDIAELVCCALEVLDSTGWNEQKVFNSAVLIDNDEWAVPLSSSLNSWLVALKDTHLTSAYVITNEVCLECEVPDHTTSTCETSEAFTALKTQITTAEFPWDAKADYLLKPSGERLRREECGDSALVLLTPSLRSLRTIPRVSFRTKFYECSELVNRAKPDCFRSTVYLRADKRSCRGRYEVKGSILASCSPGLRQNRNTQDIDRSLGADEAVLEEPGKQNQPKEIADQHVGSQLPCRRRAQVPPGLVQSSEGQYIRGLSTVLSPWNGPVIAHPGKQPVQKESYNDSFQCWDPTNARAPALWPMKPRTIGSDASQEITNSDVHGQDIYEFGAHQTDSHLPGEPIEYLNIRGSSQSVPEAGPSTFDRTQEYLAKLRLQ
ncbi:MAG: hypothetical protein L6R42_001704 [Xanthoria sp. 1 TBL-2021]|nr:MAG: hypothetical protein L6R42_001704 [Xanthoria sp. 1 TBL-2021]